MNEFNYQKLNDQGIAKCEEIARRFEYFLEDLEESVPAGRERALGVTNLQQACFWLKKAIALDPKNQREDS